MGLDVQNLSIVQKTDFNYGNFNKELVLIT